MFARNKHVAMVLVALLVLGLLGSALPAAAFEEAVLTGAQPAGGQSGTSIEASKTATGYWERTYEWEIDKTVEPEEWDLFCGDTATSTYTVAVTKTEAGDVYCVEGQICVKNKGDRPTEGLAIEDVVLMKTGSGQFEDYVKAPVDVSAKPVLAPGESYCYPYRVDLTPVQGAKYKNEARVTITNHSGRLPGGQHCPGPDPCPFGPNPDAGFDLPSTPNREINATIHVTDTNGGEWAFSDSGSVSYDRTFSCGEAECSGGTYANTATITETGASATASVTVRCHELDVQKDAQPSLTRTHSWDIAKKGSVSELTLAAGEWYAVDYAVTVAHTGYQDSDWAVNGTVTVANNAPIPATITNVADAIEGLGPVDVDCGPDPAPYVLAANGGCLVCTYSSSLPDGATRLNTATATLQNYAYHYEDDPVALGTTGFDGTATIDMANADVTHVDECVDVWDDKSDPEHPVYLGEVCYPEASKSWRYSRDLGGYEECGRHQVTNRAWYEGSDTGAAGHDTWTVSIDVPCVGCTLTQGYWKTHSAYGPAAHPDTTWLELAEGPDTPFFLSGQSWYQVLWTPPAGGNAYYILAHQYIAARLNMLNGASSTPAVDAALAGAEILFGAYTPSEAAALKGKYAKEIRNSFLGYAGILGSYNEGLIGPGHCDE